VNKCTQISPTWGLDQIQIFITCIGTTILISHNKVKPQEIMLPNTMNCTILNICNLIINLQILHLTIIWNHSHHLKTQSKHSYMQVARIFKSLRSSVTMNNNQIIQELKTATMSNSQNIQELTNEIRDLNQFTHQAIVKME
jgi:sensor histidine kinase regulating citrate/malate metabolism